MTEKLPTNSEILELHNKYVPHKGFLDPSMVDYLARECNEWHRLNGVLLDRLKTSKNDMDKVVPLTIKTTKEIRETIKFRQAIKQISNLQRYSVSIRGTPRPQSGVMIKASYGNYYKVDELQKLLKEVGYEQS